MRRPIAPRAMMLVEMGLRVGPPSTEPGLIGAPATCGSHVSGSVFVPEKRPRFRGRGAAQFVDTNQGVPW
jgi:hypothetical protein